LQTFIVAGAELFACYRIAVCLWRHANKRFSFAGFAGLQNILVIALVWAFPITACQSHDCIIWIGVYQRCFTFCCFAV